MPFGTWLPGLSLPRSEGIDLRVEGWSDVRADEHQTRVIGGIEVPIPKLPCQGSGFFSIGGGEGFHVSNLPEAWRAVKPFRACGFLPREHQQWR